VEAGVGEYALAAREGMVAKRIVVFNHELPYRLKRLESPRTGEFVHRVRRTTPARKARAKLRQDAGLTWLERNTSPTLRRYLRGADAGA
jgi:hypothetical protein